MTVGGTRDGVNLEGRVGVAFDKCEGPVALKHARLTTLNEWIEPGINMGDAASEDVNHARTTLNARQGVGRERRIDDDIVAGPRSGMKPGNEGSVERWGQRVGCGRRSGKARQWRWKKERWNRRWHSRRDWLNWQLGDVEDDVGLTPRRRTARRRWQEHVLERWVGGAHQFGGKLQIVGAIARLRSAGASVSTPVVRRPRRGTRGTACSGGAGGIVAEKISKYAVNYRWRRLNLSSVDGGQSFIHPIEVDGVLVASPRRHLLISGEQVALLNVIQTVTTGWQAVDAVKIEVAINGSGTVVIGGTHAIVLGRVAVVGQKRTVDARKVRAVRGGHMMFKTEVRDGNVVMAKVASGDEADATAFGLGLGGAYRTNKKVVDGGSANVDGEIRTSVSVIREDVAPIVELGEAVVLVRPRLAVKDGSVEASHANGRIRGLATGRHFFMVSHFREGRGGARAIARGAGGVGFLL
jgi:hypothetical protein